MSSKSDYNYKVIINSDYNDKDPSQVIIGVITFLLKTVLLLAMIKIYLMIKYRKFETIDPKHESNDLTYNKFTLKLI